MPIPYLLVILIYAIVGLLSAIDASLVSLNVFNVFPALRWMRVHFVTLGILSQTIFGLLPTLVASFSKKPRPPMRWDIWLLLNAGLVVLIGGFGGIIQPVIFIGGALVFAAVILLAIELVSLRDASPASLKFYLTALAFLLVGIIIGTGLYLGWSEPLRIKVPLEAHIHANTWGFMSLMFVGLLIDLVPSMTGQRFGSARAIRVIFWGMTLGAIALVLSPWIGGVEALTIGGIVLHIGATVVVLVSLVHAFRAAHKLNSVGAWHLIGSYAWILMPVLVAPLILTGVLESGPIESTAPQALVYGWMLQFGIALVPYVARKFILKQTDAALGGCRGTLIAMTLGSLLVWLSIFSGASLRGALYAAGFALYALAFVRLLKELFEIAQQGLQQHGLA